VFVATGSEASKTENGVRVKVTFLNGTSSNFELDPVQSIDLVASIGKALDQHRAAIFASRLPGGS
jgi:hypothetical protein